MLLADIHSETKANDTQKWMKTTSLLLCVKRLTIWENRTSYTKKIQEVCLQLPIPTVIFCLFILSCAYVCLCVCVWEVCNTYFIFYACDFVSHFKIVVKVSRNCLNHTKASKSDHLSNFLTLNRPWNSQKVTISQKHWAPLTLPNQRYVF